MTKEELYAKAEALAGRPIEVDQTVDGQFIALWMSFEKSPPKKGETEEAALENFIEHMKNMDSSAVELPAVES